MLGEFKDGPRRYRTFGLLLLACSSCAVSSSSSSASIWGKKDLGFNCVHPVHSRMCVSSVGEFEAGGFGIVVDGICLFKDIKALGG